MRLRGISLSTLIMFSLTVNLFSQVSVSDDIYSSGVIEDTVVEDVPKSYITEVIMDSAVQAGDDLGEILGREPGIIYEKSGATGSKSTISIRGIESKKVLIFLDGVPLNSSMGESVDLSKINPEIIEAAEIYKGYIPARFGGNGFGGVVNLRKKSNVKDGKNVELSTIIGSFGEKKLHAAAWYVPHYLLDVYSTCNYTYEDNDFPYLDRHHTPHSPIDDTVRIMKNDEFTSFDFNIRPTLSLKKNRKLFAEFDILISDDNIGAYNGYEFKTAEEKSKDIGGRVVLNSLGTDYKKLAGELSLSYKNSQKTLFWTHLDTTFGIAHGTLIDGKWAKMNSNDHQVSLNGFLNFSITKKLKLEAALLSFYQAFLPTSELALDITGDWECFRLSGKASSDLNYTSEYYNLYLGGTIDAVMDSTNGGRNDYLKIDLPSDRTYTPAASWRAGGNAFLPGKFLNVFVNGGKYYKLSNLREKYGFKGGVVPNPELEDETQYSFEAGLGFKHRLFYGEGTFFYLKNNNGIVFISDGFLLRPVNLDYDRIFGGEFGVTWNLLKKLEVNTNLTLQKSEIYYGPYDGNMKPGQPALAADIITNVGPFAGLSLLWHLEYKSYFFKDLANIDGKRVPVDLDKFGFGFNHIGLKLIKKRLVLQTYIKNLPLNLFDFKLYGDYALEHLNDTPRSSPEVGYYLDNHPGIHYHFKVGFSF